MNREKAREYTRSIENLIGWKATQELIRSIQEKKGSPPPEIQEKKIPSPLPDGKSIL